MIGFICLSVSLLINSVSYLISLGVDRKAGNRQVAIMEDGKMNQPMKLDLGIQSFILVWYAFSSSLLSFNFGNNGFYILVLKTETELGQFGLLFLMFHMYCMPLTLTHVK